MAAVAQASLGSDVEGLLDYARGSPEYASMRLESEAAAQRVYPAGALPDPVLRTELQNITNEGNDRRASLLPNRVGATKHTLMQTFPLWGKRELRREAALGEVVQAQGRAATTWAEIAASIKAAYARYYAAIRIEELTREVAGLIQRLERVASARYESGLAPQQDVIRAQVELTGIRGELLSLEAEQDALRATLNAILGRGPDAPLAMPQRLRAPPAVARIDAEFLADRVRGSNPQVTVEDARIRVAERNRELAHRNRYPDVTAAISPIQMGSRIAEWEVMFEVTIPLQQESRRRQEAEASAMLEAARLRRQALENRLVGELMENLAALRAAQRTEILASASLLPQAEATLQSALAAYETGKVDFATLLDAQRQVRKARVDRLKAQLEAQLRLAAIERILGEDL
jgi:cobalt-zinc-cadmium efflux system outer membrane protein